MQKKQDEGFICGSQRLSKGFRLIVRHFCWDLLTDLLSFGTDRKTQNRRREKNALEYSKMNNLIR